MFMLIKLSFLVIIVVMGVFIKAVTAGESVIFAIKIAIYFLLGLLAVFAVIKKFTSKEYYKNLF